MCMFFGSDIKYSPPPPVVEIGSTTSLRWMSLRRWFLLCDGHLSDSCLVAALCLALRSRDALALMLHLAFEVRWSFVTEWFCWNYFYGQLRDMTDVELHVRMCDGYVTCDAESALHAWRSAMDSYVVKRTLLLLLVARLLHICLQLLHECSTELLHDTLLVDILMILVKRLLFVGVATCTRISTYAYWRCDDTSSHRKWYC